MEDTKVEEEVKTKICQKCGRTLPLGEFAKNKTKKYGLANWCKACTKAYNDEYRDPQKNLIGWAKRMVGCYRAMDRQRGFGDSQTITAEWFLQNIAYKPCKYCGKQGIGLIGCNRLDNTKPHTIDNVEPCCLKCNCKENIRDQLERGIHMSCKHKKQSFSSFVEEHKAKRKNLT